MYYIYICIVTYAGVWLHSSSQSTHCERSSERLLVRNPWSKKWDPLCLAGANWNAEWENLKCEQLEREMRCHWLRQEGSQVGKEIPEEGWRAHRPKRCTDINKDEDNSPKNRNTTRRWMFHRGNDMHENKRVGKGKFREEK